MQIALPHASKSSTIANRAAFTFIEVLFSIIILGVGMIMIAGMLPVAIKQNADTRNDLTAKIVCESGFAYVRTLAQLHPEAFPETHGANTVGDGASLDTDDFPDLAKLMQRISFNPGDQLGTDEYTTGAGPLFPKNVNPAAINPPTVRRAGRMLPLSYDVVSVPNASPVTKYNLGTLLKNYDDNHSANPPTLRQTDISDYPLAWHQTNLGDRIVSSDPRFQWMAFYRRDEGSTLLHVIIVAMRQQTAEVVDRYRAVSEPSTANNATMTHERLNGFNGPFLVPVQIENSLTEADKLVFKGTATTDNADINAAEVGTYVIICHSPPLNGSATQGDLQRPFRNNGRIFQLAARRDDLDPVANGRVWDLAPGFDLASASEGNDGIINTADDLADGSMNTAQTYPVDDNRADDVKGTIAYAWIIGRGRVDPTSGQASTPFAGATQDLGVLSVDIPLK